jgi:hypothetical protein
MLMHDDASAELACQIAAVILNAFPDKMYEAFIRRIVFQLKLALHPGLSKTKLNELLKDMENLGEDGWV